MLFRSKNPLHRINRPTPLVAGSVGPYGAYLADGSEYLGNYKIGGCCRTTPEDIKAIATWARQ